MSRAVKEGLSTLDGSTSFTLFQKCARKGNSKQPAYPAAAGLKLQAVRHRVDITEKPLFRQRNISPSDGTAYLTGEGVLLLPLPKQKLCLCQLVKM